MKLRSEIVILLLAVFILSPKAWAEDLPLTTLQIGEYLSGQTVEGVQNGVQWKQMFYAKGDMVYHQNTLPDPIKGVWKATNDLYCSRWPPAKHRYYYTIFTEGEKIVFIPEDGTPYWPAIRLGNSSQPEHKRRQDLGKQSFEI